VPAQQRPAIVKPVHDLVNRRTLPCPAGMLFVHHLDFVVKFFLTLMEIIPFAFQRVPFVFAVIALLPFNIHAFDF